MFAITRGNRLQVWRLIQDNDKDGLTNMATDEAISIACGEGKSPATLRFYGWKTPTVSIGYSQKKESGIDIQYCELKGMDIIRRPTGGRAVLHENELTFSLSASTENPLFPRGILPSHKKISEALLLGMNRMGIEAVLQQKSSQKRSRHPVCFSSPSIYELVSGGKKIVGCAQRRFKKSFLEHGSIPFKLDRVKLSSVFCNASTTGKIETEPPYLENMAGINELGLRHITFDSLAENIAQGFKEYFGINFKQGTLSGYETGLMKKILVNSL